jgi:hypothetical protein
VSKNTVPTRDPFIEKIAEAVVNRMCEVAGVKRLADVLCTDRAGEPAAFVREDQSLTSSTQPSGQHNRGPPLDEPAVMSVPEFCAWAKISRSTLYAMWTEGAGPRFFKAGTATRISRQSAAKWLLDREAAGGAESHQLAETA